MLVREGLVQCSKSDDDLLDAAFPFTNLQDYARPELIAKGGGKLRTCSCPKVGKGPVFCTAIGRRGLYKLGLVTPRQYLKLSHTHVMVVLSTPTWQSISQDSQGNPTSIPVYAQQLLPAGLHTSAL